MPEENAHPSTSELSAFSLGALSTEKAAEIEQHVATCEPCCETMVNLSADDTFVGLLQVAGNPSHSPTLLSGETSDQNDDHTIPLPLASHSRYELEQLVGKGGMGRVFKARHRMMDRVVALKVIHREWIRRQEAIDRFRREMKSAASLNHPNIVTAYDAEHADDLHFLVMEYVDGEDLAETVRQQGALPVATACDYIQQAAEGLQHAHERGMVHRDIKPHNLIVTKDNVVKILDFGLASLSPPTTSNDPITDGADGNLTIAGAIMGTPDFISPEQARDAGTVDGRSDIYSLGMTLYYLLAGRVPFTEGSATDKLKQHAETKPARLSEIRDDVPQELQDVIDRMTAKDPAERFQSPEEVADALRSINSGSGSQPPLRNIRHNGGSFPGWFRGVVLLAAIVGICLIFYGREQRIAKADYKALSTFLITGEREEHPSRIVERLISTDTGREYLRKLDTENSQLAFAEGDFVREYRFVVAFAYDDRLAVMGWNDSGLGQSISDIPNGFTLDSLRFDNQENQLKRVYMRYMTAAAERGILGDLKPHSKYEANIPIDHLIKGPLSFRELFQGGTPVPEKSTQNVMLAASAIPRLRLDGKTVSSNTTGLPRIRTWNFNGRDVEEMNVRLLLAQNGMTKVVQEYCLTDLPSEFQNDVRLDIRDATEVGHGRNIDATLHVEMPSDSRATTVGDNRGMSVTIDAPFSADFEQTGLDDIDSDETQLLFAKGYWKGDFDHGPSMNEMTEATKDSEAIFLFVTVDWKPLDPEVAEQRLKRSSDGANVSGGEIIQRLLDHGEHPLDRLKPLICEAAGIPADQWDEFARSPIASTDSINGEPLSLALLKLEVHESASTAALEEFRYTTDGPLRPTDLHNAMSPTKHRGNYSILKPNALSDLRFDVASVDGQSARLEGDFSFELPDICAGRISYVAHVDENSDLSVTEFSLPNRGITIRLTDEETWKRVERVTTLEAARAAIVGSWRARQMTVKGWPLPQELVELVQHDFTQKRYRLLFPKPGRNVCEPYEEETYALHQADEHFSITIGEEDNGYQGLVEFEDRDTLRLYLPIDLAANPTELISADAAAYTLDVLERVDFASNPQLDLKTNFEPAGNVAVSIRYKSPAHDRQASVTAELELEANQSASVAKLIDLASSLNEIDWTKANSEAVVFVYSKGRPLAYSLSIEGVQNPGPGEPLMIATWREGDGKVTRRQRQSRPLRNANDAFSLIYSFFLNDGRMDSLTSWNDVKPTEPPFVASGPVTPIEEASAITDEPPVLAHFHFNGDTTNSANGEGIAIVNDPVFQRDSLMLDGKYRKLKDDPFRLRTPKLNYRSFAVAIRFKADSLDGAILSGGPLHRWMVIEQSESAKLTIRLGRFNYDVAQIKSGEWYNLVCSHDRETGTVQICLNGVALEPMQIGTRKFDVEGSPQEETAKEWVFRNPENAFTFHGLIDEFVVFGRALTKEEACHVDLGDETDH